MPATSAGGKCSGGKVTDLVRRTDYIKSSSFLPLYLHAAGVRVRSAGMECRLSVEGCPLIAQLSKQ